jgi:hypothetical protein
VAQPVEAAAREMQRLLENKPHQYDQQVRKKWINEKSKGCAVCPAFLLGESDVLLCR